MASAARRGIVVAVTFLVLVVLGAGVSFVIGDALGIRSEPAPQMSSAAVPPSAAASAVSPPRLTVDAPEGVRTRLAIEELTDATASAGSTTGVATLTVTAGGGSDADDGYTLTGTSDALRIEATSETGAVRGIYDIAAQIRAGRPIVEHLGESVTSKLPLRMVDLGAVGVAADPAEWESGTNYSHASGAFEDAYLPAAPYIDERALEADYAEWDDFLRHSVALGYNAVAWPGFIEYVTFAGAPGGGVYAEGDEHIARAEALVKAFSPFWDRARELGVKVYLRTDMLALTPQLSDYFDARFGSADTSNPELWSVYTSALEQLYEQQPGLSGVLIRVGEGGSIYQEPGWDYYSALAVRSVSAVQTMLDAFLAGAEASDREVIFRTWSVGIGDVGDMHTDPVSYDAVFETVSSPRLIVSTKYTLGDFYSWLPLNNTLEIGDQRRIIEFQARREFEGFGAFPNDLGPELQGALQSLLAENPRIEGVWTWTQDGGPWRAGPMSLYLKTGFWQLSEHNTLTAAALARDPAADLDEITQGWARRYFSEDPATVDAIVRAMASSRDAIRQGLYLQPFAENRVFAVGLEPPPQMWLFEWDILTGDSATPDTMYSIVGDRTDEAIELGEQAVATAEGMRDGVQATDAATWRDPGIRAAFTAALEYEVDTLRLLSTYRTMFLRQAQWHDDGSAESYARWQGARDEYVAQAAAHLASYEGDVAHPAWNLTAATLGVDRADRDLAMSWSARILLVFALAWVVIGMLSARTRLVGRPGAGAARATWLASTRPWRARESTLGMRPLDRGLAIIVPGALLVATRGVQTSFLAPAHLLLTLGAWLVFVVTMLLLLRGRSAWPVITAVAGVTMLRCILTLLALSFTGPGGYWFGFWTDPARRTAYVSLAVAAFLWTFVAAGWAYSSQVGARRATGSVLAAVGAGLAVPAAIVAVIGLEPALTVWNDQMGLLPWGLARILGITTYLEIPASSAGWAAALGGFICAVGLAMALTGRADSSGVVGRRSDRGEEPRLRGR
ncbi:hypothetical protein [Microbacterium sp. P03]|uniref:hypothetical protein n=1 Tax=Microbacterium sp. P03 TaxID=3366946 RepID=UPI003745706A